MADLDFATVAKRDELGFDPEKLRAKYREERDKRLRADGNEQYVEVTGQFAHYLDDPYVERIERSPVEAEFEVLIIGGGFGGQLAGARLRQAGVTDIRVVEKGGDFGGTWYWNRYPGAACDIESYVYLPLLEETGFMPTKKYTEAAEILEYSRMIGRKYDLYKGALFQTQVTRMDWDEEASRWIVSTDRGDTLRPRFVIMANGPLNRPKLPGIPGIESFRGHTFHTSRWDYDYTGGNAYGGLDRIGDKTIGIIGTGATAVQCVPHLGAGAKQLYVFQRTPSSIDVRNDKPTDPDWASSLTPGWHQHRMDNFNILVSGGHQEEDLVADGWTDIIRNLSLVAHARAAAAAGAEQTPAELIALADFKKMESIRSRVDEVVRDKATADALKPWYRQFCKRPCFHDEYLKTFNRPNVTLVDTDGHGVERITEKGIVANGREYELDCIVFATGFEVGTGYERRAGYDMHGRGGQTLADKWEQGCRTLHGMTVNGFPNCFMMGTIQAGFTANYPHALNEQAKHVAAILGKAQAEGVTEIEPTREAEEAWLKEILGALMVNASFLAECTPGYYNNEGKPSPIAATYAPYGKGSMAYFDIIRDWRETGGFAGLELRKAG